METVILQNRCLRVAMRFTLDCTDRGAAEDDARTD
ncbi:MAG: hypothetical protein RL318_1737 [Fibrobacterota bacterium]